MERKLFKLFLILILMIVSIYIYYFYCSINDAINRKNNIYKTHDKSNINKSDEIEDEDLEIDTNSTKVGTKLEIKSLKMSSLVVIGEDNSYYLDHDLNGLKNDIGTPFFDYRNKDIINDLQVNIYGHNTNNNKIKNQLPLSNLEKLVNKDEFNKEHKVILTVNDLVLEYKIIAIKVITEDDNEHMVLNFQNNEEYQMHIDKLFENTLYQKIKPTVEEKILILQICNYYPENTYLLVIGVRN